uniref:(2Fe-2S) ferredoxin n=1 Tax=Candidatus Kentrum sp. FM TaxID=2126340 RepID=A0A450WZX7_9GAMM|nr:MAG: (2Fe-2S) ferredoxin [Candidatus Kentron sp. FM]VFJ77150.1 MAG: (2Fe-2S) ferredoxin [Candidatus Kentron sp. FM]VFK22604.1 MAG: (2Fe-2S) ferredoxin [Candidatus Kentron sp. FM]
MPRPSKHVFICTRSRPADDPTGSCNHSGADEVVEEFMAQFQARNLWQDFVFTKTGCLGYCQFGPTVLVYPDGVLYGKVTKADVTAIIDEHLMAGKPVERLQVPADVW